MKYKILVKIENYNIKETGTEFFSQKKTHMHLLFNFVLLDGSTDIFVSFH